MGVWKELVGPIQSWLVKRNAFYGDIQGCTAFGGRFEVKVQVIPAIWEAGIFPYRAGSRFRESGPSAYRAVWRFKWSERVLGDACMAI